MAVSTKKGPKRNPAGAFSNRQNKWAEKTRNLSDAELAHHQRELADQIFRLKFQMTMGQTEGLKKVQSLRKELARVRTIIRGRQLGIEPAKTEKK